MPESGAWMPRLYSLIQASTVLDIERLEKLLQKQIQNGSYNTKINI